MSVLFDACADQASRRRWLGSTDLKVRTATAPKSMRLSGTDGTSVVLAFTAKGRTKSSVAVQITKLPDKAAADRARKVWSEHLGALASHLKSTPSKEPASP